ncbi:MAG: hypothetical protein KA479_13260 [Saprospiraceae bacterium]|nr:hypothetical protein [Saprospiraceae bacterium]
MIKSILISLLLSTPLLAFAQPYMEGGNTRHRFAQMYFGADVRYFPGAGTKTLKQNNQDIWQSATMSDQAETRFLIGGTHFWGHADFYLGFVVAGMGQSGMRSSVETGGRFFPWRLESRKTRPFVGVSWMPVRFRQGDGVQQLRHRWPLSAGLVHTAGHHLFELNGGYIPSTGSTYYFDVAVYAPVKTHPFWLSLGYKYVFDTTLSAEKNWQSGHTQTITDTLAKRGRLNGLTVGIGPSASIFLKESSYTKNVAPWLDDHKMARVFPEFTIGYYIHNPDIQVNLVYRSINSRLKAYGTEQHARRRALTLESYWFAADYHGFVPFVGVGMSSEWLKVTHKEPSSDNMESATHKFKPGLVFGWDIRPNRLQSWYLRTHLRWYPGLDVVMDGGRKVSLDQLEFNFIQFVMFPGRMF